MNVIIFGAPGAGKGTQAQNIVKKFNLRQVSTGDLLRNEIKNKNEIGKKIEEIVNRGEFVSDDIVNKLLENVITNQNYIPSHDHLSNGHLHYFVKRNTLADFPLLQTTIPNHVL